MLFNLGVTNKDNYKWNSFGWKGTCAECNFLPTNWCVFNFPTCVPSSECLCFQDLLRKRTGCSLVSYKITPKELGLE